MTEHLSRHQLEQLVAREGGVGLRAPTRSELQAHAHALGCDVCTTRKRSIETARGRMLALLPAAEFARATFARAANAPPAPALAAPWRRRAAGWALGGTALAIAAAALLWIRAPSASPTGETIRLKGTAGLEVFVKRGDRVEPIRDGAALARGDQLGFVYTLSEPRHLLLLGVDDRGAITRYFPADGAAALLATGARQQLPIGVELDADRGEERLIAFFGASPLDEGAVRRAIAAELERARSAGGGLSSLRPIDVPAQQASVWFRKP